MIIRMTYCYVAKEGDSLSRDVTKIQMGILLISIVSFVASFNPEWKLWGLDSMASFPVILRVALLILLMLVLLPRVQQKIGQKLTKHFANLSITAVTSYYFIMAAILLGLFVLMTSNNHLLGDGFQILGNLAYGKNKAPFEFLTNSVIRAVYGITEGGESGALWAYRIWAFIAGAVFLASLWYFLKNKADVWIVLAVSLTFAVMQFFAGYVEHYTMSFVFMFLYLMSAQRDLEEERFSPLTIVLLLIGVAFHLQVGVLIPSLVYVAYHHRHSRAVLAIGIVLSLSLLAGAVIYSSSATQLAQIALPLSPTAESPYHLFSSEHLGDIANLLLLNCPIVLVMLPTYSFWNLRFRVFHILTIVPTMLFTVLVDPKLGALRDWDLMSVASAPMMVAIFAMFQSSNAPLRRHVSRLLVPILLFAVIHTGGWLWLNSSASDSYERVKSIVKEDLHYSARYHEGYRNQSWAQIVRTYYADANETIRSLEVRVHAKPDDESSRYNLAKAYSIFRNDSTAAARLVSGHWRLSLAQPETIKSIAFMLARVHNYAEAEEVLDAFVASGGSDPQIFSGLAALKESRGEFEQAWKLYKASLDIQREPPPASRLSFSVFSIQHGHSQEGVIGLQEVTPLLPEPIQSVARNLLSALTRSDRKEIDSLCAILR
jgi:hypothetical protein